MAYKILVVKHVGMRLPGRTKHRYEHHIRMDLGKRGRKVVDWIRLAQDRARGVLL